ncbi:purine catabolism regulator [Arthrobacter woluwensis]|uniref:PucR family transcriptional regulator n=1 Tax=Arthrobacter woluwensis TaxID=156980 RepID=UPI002780492A|nr:PucR family transcriptional regulator [Arthrobacter woluwensis]MDQ0708332.1 purine catabolism regulator [Arthrobacter woluwensis]
MISLAHVQTTLGARLTTLDGRPPAARTVSGVHISELDDPTPYLEGGELLLTTGIPFRGPAHRTHEYVARLARHGVSALGLGLGAGLNEVPGTLVEACRDHGVELLIVPDGVPFMDVSRVYWDLVARLGQSDLVASLGTQTALARAAARPDALASVVRALAQALGGWAAYLPAEEAPSTVWPDSTRPLLPQLKQETARLNLRGLRSAATFQVHGADVVAHPVLVGQRIAGVLAIGAGRTLTRADRQVIQTVCVLLSLKAQQDEEADRRTSLLHAAVARLLIGGHLEAARLLAGDIGVALPAGRIRVLLLDGLPEGATDRELAAVLGTLDGGLSIEAGALRLRCTEGEVEICLLDDDAARHPADRSPGERPGVVVRAVLSAPLTPAQVPGRLEPLREVLTQAAPGALTRPPVSPLDPRAAGWVETLRAQERGDLLATVQCYLRNRGQWEPAARELGIHRNSLRHRIGIAQRLLQAELDDPDVAANLWLALRAS